MYLGDAYDAKPTVTPGGAAGGIAFYGPVERDVYQLWNATHSETVLVPIRREFATVCHSALDT